MTEKQSILGRIAQLTGTDIPALLGATQDPGVMLDQLVRDITATIAETEEAISVSEANTRLAELDRDEDRAAAERWATAAQAAWDRGDELRAKLGNTEPTAFDSLAETARSKQYSAEGAAGMVEPLVRAQHDAIAWLKDGLTSLRTTLHELKENRNDLVAEAAAAPGSVPAAAVNVMDPASDFARYEAELEQIVAREFADSDAATDVTEHLAVDDSEPDAGAESEAVEVEFEQPESEAESAPETPDSGDED